MNSLENNNTIYVGEKLFNTLNIISSTSGMFVYNSIIFVKDAMLEDGQCYTMDRRLSSVIDKLEEMEK